MDIVKNKSRVEIKLTWAEKILSLHGDFLISRKNIISIKEGAPRYSWFELRLPGSFLPGILKAGTYYARKRGKEFWFWHFRRKYVYTIELKDLTYKRLVLGVNKKIST